MSVNAPWICHMNVNGIGQRVDELREYTRKMYVVSLQDTRLRTPEAMLSVRARWPGFRWYGFLHDDSGPGVVLLVDSSLHQREVKRVTRHRHRLVSVEVTLPGIGNRPILISSLYATPPPNGPMELPLLRAALDSPRALLLGDLNAKIQELGCRTTNGYGVVLQTGLDETNAIVLNDPRTPTFYDNSSAARDCLDWAIASPLVSTFLPTCTVGVDIGSDHRPLLIFPRQRTTRTAILRSALSELPPRWRTEGIEDWSQIQRAMYEEITAKGLDSAPTPTSPNILEEQVQQLEEALQCAADRCLKRALPPDPRGPRLPHWILLMIKERRRLRSRLDRLPPDRAPGDLKHEINAVTAHIRKAINEHHRSLLDKQAAHLAAGPRDENFWATVKVQFRNGGQPDMPSLQPSSQDGSPACSPTERAAAFADHLHRIASAEDSGFDEQHYQAIRESIREDPHIRPLSSLPEQIPSFCRVSAYDVERRIRRLRPGKAPGPDGIDSTMLKNSPPFLVHILARLFSASLSLGYVPGRWKTATIRMLPKAGKRLDQCSHYRPIALTSTLGKLLDGIVTQRIMQICRDEALIPERQSAFQPGRNAVEQVTLLCQRIVQTMNAGLCTVAVALDMAKAFDRVWHDGLIALIRDLLPTEAVRWVAAFLQDRSSRVMEQHAISTSFHLPAGVPQGSPLSPLLYILFTREMPEPSGWHTGSTVYADDICLWSSRQTPGSAWAFLRPTLESISDWCRTWRMSISPEKTQVCAFTRRNQPWPVSALCPLRFRGHTLEFSPTLDLLGVRLDRLLHFGPYSILLAERLGPRILELRRLMWLSRRIPRWIGALLYKAMIRPALLYSAPLLLPAPHSTWRRLDRLERRGLRAALRTGLFTPIEDLHRISRTEPLRNSYESAAKDVVSRFIRTNNRRLLDSLQPERQPRSDLAFWDPPLNHVLPLLAQEDRDRLPP